MQEDEDELVVRRFLLADGAMTEAKAAPEAKGGGCWKLFFGALRAQVFPQILG